MTSFKIKWKFRWNLEQNLGRKLGWKLNTIEINRINIKIKAETNTEN